MSTSVRFIMWLPLFLVAGYSPQQYDYPELVEQMGLITDTKHRFASAYANLTYTYKDRYNIFGSMRKDYADLFWRR